MNLNSDFKKPRRVWVNAPSTLDIYHKYHGKIGIAVFTPDLSQGHIVVYFTEGEVLGQEIDPRYLALAAGEYDNKLRAWVVEPAVFSQ
jgi:hypothetical protein